MFLETDIYAVFNNIVVIFIFLNDYCYFVDVWSDLFNFLVDISLLGVVWYLGSFVGLSVDELASLTIGTVAILHVLFAVLGLIQGWYILFQHHLLLSVGERALVTELTFAIELKILAHFCPELVDVWCRWGKVMLSTSWSERIKQFVDDTFGLRTVPLCFFEIRILD